MFALVTPGFTQSIPKLTSISPEWVQRGTTADIVISGDNLSSSADFVFSGEDTLEVEVAPPSKPAIRLESSAGNLNSTGPANDAKRVSAKLKISANATLGAHEMRVLSPDGVSNPLTIRVSDTPETVETGNNHSIAEAPKMKMPVGISGRIRTADQVDMFRFEAKKGEQIIFEVQANRLGSPLDSSLAILDVNGKELVRNEDAFGLDAFLVFAAPADGDYIVTLRDFERRGGNNYTYHLTMGVLPYVESIFPFGGQRGQSVELALSGVNLDGADKLKIDIDANAPGGPQEVRAHTPKGISNPLQFDVSSFGDITEKEPNNAATNANEVSLPGNINGSISEAGETDVFKFKVEKTQRLIFEIYARRFNSKLDPLLTLLNSKGEVMQRNDDAAGADARIDQTFEPGEYFISIRDLLDRGGKNFGYRLSIDPPVPADFSAKLLADTLRLHRGGRTIVRVEVGRSGFGGPIEIFAEDLPKGVSATPLIVPADFPTALLQFTASEDAELGSTSLELKAAALLGGKRETRPVQTVSGTKPTVYDKRGRAKKTEGKSVAAAYLTVLEEAPFAIDWLTLSAGLEQNDSTKVSAEVKRRGDFKGEVKVSVEGYSAANEAITRSFDVGQDTVKVAETRADISMKARLDSETGTRSVFAKAEATVNGMTFVEYSRGMSFRIGEFPFTLANSLPRLNVTIPPAGVTSNVASEAEFSVKTVRRGLFTDDINLAVEGLPEGITISSANILRGAGEAAFHLIATDKAKAGTNNFAVIGTANVNGRSFRLRGPDVQLIVNPPSELKETAAVK